MDRFGSTMRRNFVFLFFIVVIYDTTYGMTRAQMKKTLKVMKNQCMPKNGVTEDEVGSIDQGKFIEDKRVMCYIACVYKTLGVIKNDRLNRDAISKQVDVLYPAEMKEPVKAAIDKCIHVQDGYKDLCEAVYWSAKCLYDTDPDNFVFA